MMTYKEAIDYLFSQLPIFQRIGKAAYKADLVNTKLLDEHLKYPHKEYQVIHVAGTNGKGSVSHMLASVLQEAGYKTGLYTSPHYLDFRERIKVNGECVSKKFVARFIADNRSFIEKVSPSFFELTVVMAFEYFRNQNIDVAVVEVGMGGRLVSTNIVTPLVSVITNIGHDHQQFLGDSLDKIAGEKAGIIKRNIPVVIGETQEETKPVFIEKASELSSVIYFADEEINVPYALLTMDQKQQVNVEDKSGNRLYKDLKLDLTGSYQLKNLKTVLQTINVLKARLEISEEAIYKGIENTIGNTGILGRFMTLGNNPKIICDAAHNQEGLKLLFEQVKDIPCKDLHIITGFVNDKPIDSLIRVFPKTAKYYFTKADIPRALDENEVLNKFKVFGIAGGSFNTVSKALEQATKRAGVNDLILICGSTFIVAEAITFLKTGS